MQGLCLNTFSIVARCPRTGELGVAVSTAIPGVGGLCPFIEAGRGAVTTQSWLNPYLAIDLLARLGEGPGGQGQDAETALQGVLADDAGRDLRQLAVVDASGRAAAWTGPGCTDWAGQILGEGFSVQGNMLVGAETIAAMAEGFESCAGADLAERLMIALERGQAAGGDKRGKQSAALKVHAAEAYPRVDLRVDEHAEPVAELRRVHDIARQQLRPFVDAMPKRGQKEVLGPPEAVQTMLMTPPPFRPGGGGSGRS